MLRLRSAAVVADDLDEQPLLRAEVVVQQAARDARLARHVVERRRRRRRGVPTLARIAAMMRWALSPSSLRGASALVAASIPRAILAGWPARSAEADPTQRKGRPLGAPLESSLSGVRARRCPPVRSCCSAPGWCSPCTRTPPRRRTARRAPSCAGPRSRRARARRRRAPRGAGGPCRASSSCPAQDSAASFSEAAASRSSFCVFLSSEGLDRALAVDIRPYAFRADSNAVRRLSRSSSSSTSRCTYSL